MAYDHGENVSFGNSKLESKFESIHERPFKGRNGRIADESFIMNRVQDSTLET